LEYAGSAWDPYQKIYVARIEAIQKRAAHWVLNNYSRYSNVTTMLQQLQWPTLEERHRRARLSLFYKARNNLVALQIPIITFKYILLKQDFIINPPMYIHMLEHLT